MQLEGTVMPEHIGREISVAAEFFWACEELRSMNPSCLLSSACMSSYPTGADQ